MAQYFALLGRRIEVHYRAGDISLPATGTLVADSGKSIFLEEHFCRRGAVKNFRWEIPYQCIVRLTESPAAPAEDAELVAPAKTGAGAAHAASEPRLFPLKDRPKEA